MPSALLGFPHFGPPRSLRRCNASTARDAHGSTPETSVRPFPADCTSQRLDCGVNPTPLRFEFLDDSVQILHAVNFNPSHAELYPILDAKDTGGCEGQLV